MKKRANNVTLDTRPLLPDADARAQLLALIDKQRKDLQHLEWVLTQDSRSWDYWVNLASHVPDNYEEYKRLSQYRGYWRLNE